jgi:hypothetical protein
MCSREAAKEKMLYSYSQAMNGFSAKLTDDQVKALQGRVFLLVHSLQFSHLCQQGSGTFFQRLKTWDLIFMTTFE